MKEKIMADEYIKKKDIKEKVTAITGEWKDGPEFWIPIEAVLGNIDLLPAENVVSIVPCKNCKHWDSDYMLEGCGDDVHYCPVVDKRKHETGYCDEAEEKNNL